MKCLDTDLLVAILRNTEEGQKLAAELDEESKAATTSVNAFEIFFGANKSVKKNENVKEASRLLERLIVYPLDFSSSQVAGEISARLLAEGATIDYRDVMIAAIAIENQLTLITRNTSHFRRIKNLKIETW